MRTLLNDFFDNLKAISNKIITKISEKIQKMKLHYENNKKWTLYLYLNNQCINKRKIDKDFSPMQEFYIVKVKRCKHLIGTNKSTKMIFEPYKYKMTDKEKKESHIEVRPFEGVR